MGNLFSDIWDSMSGNSARQDIQQGQQQANQVLDQGLATGNSFYDKAATNFSPYVQGGNAFYKRYADSMGVNGADAQKAVQGEYMADPIQNALMDRITKANTRANVATGTYNSGAATQSLTNALLANWGQYQQQLGTGGQQGMQATAAQSGIYTGEGDNAISVANQKAGVATSGANAMAASRGTLANNLINLAGTGVRAATGRWN